MAPPHAISSATNWLYVNPGGYHTCALTRAGGGYCMGTNNDGQLGNGGGPGTTMSPVTGGRTFRGLSSAVVGFHTCGVTTGNRAFCWGDNTWGQLGDGTQTDRTTPVAVVAPS